MEPSDTLIAPEPSSSAFAASTSIIMPPPQALRFHGKGSEYFGIWIVNILLTILTFGIYSAWAKVRRLKYFYRATELDGSGFDYHGSPIAILKGRIIALVLLVSYQVSAKFLATSPWMFGTVLLLLVVIAPWLVWNSFRFGLFNSSYRGLRFGFDGKVGGMYRIVVSWTIPFFVFGVLAAIAIPLAKAQHMTWPAVMLGISGGVGFWFLFLPFCHRQLKRYQHGNARYGATKFSFDATFGQFAGRYLLTTLLALGGFVLMAIILSSGFASLHLAGLQANTKPDLKAMGPFIAIGLLLYLGLSLIVGPFFTSRIQNLIWNSTRLGTHRIENRLSARGLLGVYLLMFFGMLFTLGLYYPWAMVRLTRYRIERLTFIPGGPLDAFVAGQMADPSALGMEAASMFDIDISI